MSWILRAFVIFFLLVLALASRPLAFLGPPMGSAPVSLAFGILVALTALALEAWVRGREPRALAGGTVGIIVAGLAASMVLRAVPDGAFVHGAILRPFVYAVVVWAGAVGGARWARALTRKAEPAAAPARILDTSAVVDGRIAEVVGAGFLEPPLLVPSFVLREIRQIADSDDPARRQRGKRALETLEKLGRSVTIGEDDGVAGNVDERLVALAAARKAALVTTDHNLNRVASLHGVRVLNVNELSMALRPRFVPGETLRLRVVKEGREPGQGVGYLDDGTMVVVEGGRDAVGSEVDTVVTGTTQTASGRMLFVRIGDTAN